MTERAQKTFKVICAHCDRPFHVRFPLARPDAEGESEVVVSCPYPKCQKSVVVKIPQTYIPEESFLRGIKSSPAEG